VLNKLKIKIMDFLGLKELGPIFTIVIGVMTNIAAVILSIISTRIFDLDGGEIVGVILIIIMVLVGSVMGMLLSFDEFEKR